MGEFSRRELLGDNTLVHKIWRGHNGEWIFEGDDKKLNYLFNLNKTILKSGADLHALCLMSNHTHEIYFVRNQADFSNYIRRHHTSFAMFYNRILDRRGPVSESRPKTHPIRNDIHEIISVLYIHANPIRAGIVKNMEDLKNYEWSTHLLYGYGIYKEWMKSIVLPKWYLDFGTTDEERQKHYLYLFSEYLETTEDKFAAMLHA